jgi:outer membrane protein OmpA-like peptidoglycan-associated protein
MRMNNKYRLYLPLIMILSMTGCSVIHNSIGPDKMQSDLREQVDAPLDVASGQAPICVVENVMPSPQKPIVRIPVPYNAKLYFLLDKTAFSAVSEQESKEVYQTLLKRNDNRIIISGHTDTSASDAYNEGLSQRRARKVRQDLIDLGISTDRMHSSSEGERRLLVSTPDETVEELNRRVEIDVR